MQPWLHTLVRQLQDERTVAITLTGSYARGEATPYSDADLHHYVTHEADEPYQVRYVGETLVSISAMLAEDKYREMQSPETAIWVVEGLRQSRALHDPAGIFAALQASARAFTWDTAMQHKADAYASRQLAGLSEEALKIRGGLARDHASTVRYGTLGMVLNIATLILTQRGILLRTENDYLQQAHAALATFGAGADFDAAQDGTHRMRGLAALSLYRKTAVALESCIQPEHHSVIQTTLDIITRTP